MTATTATVIVMATGDNSGAASPAGEGTVIATHLGAVVAMGGSGEGEAEVIRGATMKAGVTLVVVVVMEEAWAARILEMEVAGDLHV